MPNGWHTKRLLELALKGLEAERNRIDEEIADIQQRLRRGAAPQATPAAVRRRGRLTAAGRKKISETMKRRWAERNRPR